MGHTTASHAVVYGTQTTRLSASTMEKTPTFLQRIIDALELTPHKLAKAIGVPRKEIEAMLAPRHALAEIDRDATWWLIAEYVDKRLAMTMAVKADLNAALQRDRAQRAARLDRWRTLHAQRLENLQERMADRGKRRS